MCESIKFVVVKFKLLNFLDLSLNQISMKLHRFAKFSMENPFVNPDFHFNIPGFSVEISAAFAVLFSTVIFAAKVILLHLYLINKLTMRRSYSSCTY